MTTKWLQGNQEGARADLSGANLGEGVKEREQMTTETQALALPDEGQFKSDFQAIARFQAIVRSQMIEGHDYGVIPGTSKPTLLKPGAEKIAKLLHLADTYEIVDKQEDWGSGFFRYLIRCRLSHVPEGVVLSEGLGECNSMESKYRWRWVWPDDVPPGVDHNTLVFHTVKGGGRQYRLPNDDIYTQVNTLLKMAKKRALVDAALSAGRLSDIFTQDMEDLAPRDEGAPPQVGGKGNPTGLADDLLCPVHKIMWFKRGKMRDFAHPVDGGGWCNKGAVEQAKAQRSVQPVTPTEEELGFGSEGGVVELTEGSKTNTPAPRKPFPVQGEKETAFNYATRLAQEVYGKDRYQMLKAIGGNWLSWESKHGTPEAAVQAAVLALAE